MFKRILVAVDGSEMSKKALEASIVLAKEQMAEITLLHVERSLAIPIGMGAVSTDVYETIRKEGEQLLEDMKAIVESNEISTKTVYLQGDPALQIVHLAEKENAQLIVIGSRGLSNIKEVMLGSVSHKVSQMAHCPVLIIK